MTEEAGSAEHGAALAERVVETVRQEPGRSMLSYQHVPWVAGTSGPMPADALAEAVFPSGRPLPPSLRAWLGFDTSLLERFGWFAPGGGFSPRPLDRLVGEEMGDHWGEFFAPLADRFTECFLLPGGSDSRRVLAVGEPDSRSEYPVLAVDVDDLPFVGLMYPGFDVYLAHTAGLVHRDFPSYTALAGDAVYGPRMREHCAHWFAGDVCAEFPF
ncbi:hypothetical protein N5079_04055 [Planotetraspora sp. A-T 1434]|uniref:hypothetical protein n=1 Tax=Planotetraspora sp. A-T 1434 TaxID=2979219 RepID=UPI0021BF66EE|nr:hypothetical protein [Planotetraspora sp. A-T 1434]MCT9929387.1 hypothetical protein [Planotetraspora sp. A-T 1434]